MRRLSGMVLAGAMLTLPAFSLTGHAQEAAAQPQAAAAPPKTTYTGDTAIVMYAINPGKEADYEKVIATLRGALAKSTAPEAKQQLAGWKVLRSEKPLTPDGTTYIHIISPVVKGADYNIVQIVYAASTDDEKLAFYNLYKGALKGALSLVQANEIAAASAQPAAAAAAGAGAAGAQ
jgi:hypothetical protein